MAWMTQGISEREQFLLDWLVVRLADRGGVCEATARRLVNDLFLREEMVDHYLRTEVGYVTLGISTFRPPPLRTLQETVSWIKQQNERSPGNQPRMRIPTEEEVKRQNEIGREMRFASLSIPGKQDHYRWLVTISEEESPEILKVWDRYCGNVSTLDRYHRMLEEGEPDPLQGGNPLQGCNPNRNTEAEEDEEEERPREKPWPKEAVRNFVREAKANMMKEKQVWNMERRRYWPCRLVVDNTVNKS